MKRLTNTGDTIVEVLLAIAVVSAAIGGAFVSVNGSSQGVAMSRERGEALKLLEGQIEQIEGAVMRAGSPSSVSMPSSGVNFCMHDGQPVTDTNLCRSGFDDRYTLSIRRLTDGYTYQTTATWDRVGGGEVQTIEMFYRAKS